MRDARSPETFDIADDDPGLEDAPAGQDTAPDDGRPVDDAPETQPIRTRVTGSARPAGPSAGSAGGPEPATAADSAGSADGAADDVVGGVAAGAGSGAADSAGRAGSIDSAGSVGGADEAARAGAAAADEAGEPAGAGGAARAGDVDAGEAPANEVDGAEGADSAEREIAYGLPPRRRRGLVGRILLVLTALLSTVVLAVTVVGWVLLTYYDQQIDRKSIDPPRVQATRPPPVPAGSETWLLVGSDVRTGSDAAQVGGARSDTMMIAYLGADGRTTIVSVPRDLRVRIPAWTDEDGNERRARTDKINAAFSAGGPALLVATLEQLTGVRIDHYAEIDFAGFQDMTAAIGGVEICLQASPFVEYHTLDNGRTVRSTNLDDPTSGFRGQEGVNHLIGEQALAFVRQRHGFPDGDLSRIRRQQAFMAAVFRKVTSDDVLLRPAKLSAFLSAVTRSVVLDDETDIADLRVLADRLRGMNSDRVTFTTVPITGQISQPVFYFTYDPQEMRAFFEKITGQKSTIPLTSPTPLEAPSRAAVTPRAGTGVTAPAPAPPPQAVPSAAPVPTGPAVVGPPTEGQPTQGMPQPGLPPGQQTGSPAGPQTGPQIGPSTTAPAAGAQPTPNPNASVGPAAAGAQGSSWLSVAPAAFTGGVPAAPTGGFGSSSGAAAGTTPGTAGTLQVPSPSPTPELTVSTATTSCIY